MKEWLPLLVKQLNLVETKWRRTTTMWEMCRYSGPGRDKRFCTQIPNRMFNMANFRQRTMSDSIRCGGGIDVVYKISVTKSHSNIEMGMNFRIAYLHRWISIIRPIYSSWLGIKIKQTRPRRFDLGLSISEAEINSSPPPHPLSSHPTIRPLHSYTHHFIPFDIRPLIHITAA